MINSISLPVLIHMTLWPWALAGTATCRMCVILFGYKRMNSSSPRSTKYRKVSGLCRTNAAVMQTKVATRKSPLSCHLHRDCLLSEANGCIVALFCICVPLPPTSLCATPSTFKTEENVFGELLALLIYFYRASCSNQMLNLFPQFNNTMPYTWRSELLLDGD